MRSAFCTEVDHLLQLPIGTLGTTCGKGGCARQPLLLNPPSSQGVTGHAHNHREQGLMINAETKTRERLGLNLVCPGTYSFPFSTIWSSSWVRSWSVCKFYYSIPFLVIGVFFLLLLKQKYFWNQKSGKSGGRRDDLAGKTTCCPSRGPELGFQHPC